MAIKTPKTGVQTRDIPSLERRATFQSSSVNEEARTVEVTWTTGEKVLRSGWDGQFFEELSLDPKHVRMGRLSSGTAPFLANHDSRSIESVLGVIESATVGQAVVRFAKNDPAADAAWNKVRQGILPNVSVGYRIHKFEKVEGGESEIPTYRASDWEPFEVSLVPMGADSAAHIRSADAQITNPCTFISRSLENNKMTPEEIAAAEAKRTLELKLATDNAVKAERERVASINLAVRALGDTGPATAEKLIAEGVSADSARETVLNALATRSEATPVSGVNRIEMGEDSREKFIRGASAWLFEKAGNGLVDLAKAKNVRGFEKTETDGAEFRGMSLMDIARLCAERAGHSLKGVYGNEKIISLALKGRSGYAGSSDFAVLFENVMHKEMRAAYGTQPHTWRRFCGTDQVPDFRASNRFLNGSFANLPVVLEGEEYENLVIPDGAKTSITTETRGAVIALSRQAMVNDDMGALVDVATRFGLSADRSIEAAVFTMLALNSGLGPTMSDSQPFFHSNRLNVSTSAALSVAALSADKVKMREQRDITSNDYLDLLPSILLVAPAQEDAAKILNNDAFDHDSTKLQKSNAARGMFADIVTSPRMNAISLTRRYLFTAAKEAFKVVFLQGSGEGPTFESQDGFRTDGTEWKARIDFKVNAYDPKTALTNTGT